MSQINRVVTLLLEPSLTDSEALKYQLFKASQDTYTKVQHVKTIGSIMFEQPQRPVSLNNPQTSLTVMAISGH